MASFQRSMLSLPLYEKTEAVSMHLNSVAILNIYHALGSLQLAPKIKLNGNTLIDNLTVVVGLACWWPGGID